MTEAYMKKLLIVTCLALATQATKTQSAEPVTIQAASAAPTAAPAAATPLAQVLQDSQTAGAAIKLLEQMKAANIEILLKQKSALERLDEAQQAAEQLKAFAARG